MSFSVKKSLFVAVLATVCFISISAQAGSLIYQPMNNAIFPDAPGGGNAALLASAQRPQDPSAGGIGGGLTDSEILRQSILGQASSAINQEIFQGNAASGGPFALGNGSTVEYTRAGGFVTVIFRDAGGRVTQITVPDL